MAVKKAINTLQERVVLTNGHFGVFYTLLKMFGIHFILENNLISCTRIEVSEQHISACRTGVIFRFISGGCI